MMWVKNGVSFQSGNRRPIIARFDNSKCWFASSAIMTAQGFKSEIKELAEKYGASIIELKYEYTDDCKRAETNVVNFCKNDDGFVFRTEIEVQEGEKRQFIKYIPESLFVSVNADSKDGDEEETKTTRQTLWKLYDSAYMDVARLAWVIFRNRKKICDDYGKMYTDELDDLEVVKSDVKFKKDGTKYVRVTVI